MTTPSDPTLAMLRRFRAIVGMPTALPASGDGRLALQEWLNAAAKNTIAAVRSDATIFQRFCLSIAQDHLPADAHTVVAFIDFLQTRGAAYSSIERHLASISTLHRLAGLASPTTQTSVKLRKRAAARELGLAQHQASPLRYDAPTPRTVGLRDMLALKPRTLVDLRDQALLSAAYDGGLRRCEIVNAQVYHLLVDDEGSGVLFIPRSKGSEKGAFAFLSAPTLKLVDRYLQAAGIEPATLEDLELQRPLPLFTIIDRAGRNTGRPVHAVEVHHIYKWWVERAAHAKGLSQQEIDHLVSAFSTHSAKIGTAQDRRAEGISLAAIAHSLRWADAGRALSYTRSLMLHQTPAGRALLARRSRAQFMAIK